MPVATLSGMDDGERHYHDVLDELRPEHRALRQAIPEVYQGFNAISAAALSDGALSR